MAFTDDFTPDEVMTDFYKFKEICGNKKLNREAMMWLNARKSWDLACSPMDDNERKLIRYGHYLGWYSSQALKSDKRKNDTRLLTTTFFSDF